MIRQNIILEIAFNNNKLGYSAISCTRSDMNKCGIGAICLNTPRSDGGTWYGACLSDNNQFKEDGSIRIFSCCFVGVSVCGSYPSKEICGSYYINIAYCYHHKSSSYGACL